MSGPPVIVTLLDGYLPAATARATLMAFIDEVLHTPQGQTLMIWGNLIGLCFAIVVLATAIVSIPLLLDRDVGAAVAIQTSIRVVLHSPVVVAVWGLMVAAILIIGAIPLLVGLAIAVPLLGHATWHLYRKAVVPVADGVAVPAGDRR